MYIVLSDLPTIPRNDNLRLYTICFPTTTSIDHNCTRRVTSQFSAKATLNPSYRIFVLFLPRGIILRKSVLCYTRWSTRALRFVGSHFLFFSFSFPFLFFPSPSFGRHITSTCLNRSDFAFPIVSILNSAKRRNQDIRLSTSKERHSCLCHLSFCFCSFLLLLLLLPIHCAFRDSFAKTQLQPHPSFRCLPFLFPSRTRKSKVFVQR